MNENIPLMSTKKAAGLICLMMGVAAMLCVGAEPAKQIDPVRETRAKQVASEWVEALGHGDIATVIALSDVPFAWDRKQIFESMTELQKCLENNNAGKKPRVSIKPIVYKVTDEKEIKNGSFPSDHIIVILVVGHHSIAVCVRPGDTYKVIGMSD